MIGGTGDHPLTHSPTPNSSLLFQLGSEHETHFGIAWRYSFGKWFVQQIIIFLGALDGQVKRGRGKIGDAD